MGEIHRLENGWVTNPCGFESHRLRAVSKGTSLTASFRAGHSGLRVVRIREKCKMDCREEIDDTDTLRHQTQEQWACSSNWKSA